ncbi:hypothetical protein PoB_007376600 [Plakobranchus ocellatus]|uniref:Uncharacterized protein n=1 Tax=Plakobranchus ocellatus TaxID=259542 RepID=A0AAV4DTP3_9GAST|nr:hypothetical protein PoB_007376600 [Plakobranchus ocellatus]
MLNILHQHPVSFIMLGEIWIRIFNTVTRLFLCACGPQQGDFRLLGHPPGVGAGGGARTRDRRIQDGFAIHFVTAPSMHLWNLSHDLSVKEWFW